MVRPAGDVHAFAVDMRKRLGGELGDDVYFQIACQEAHQLREDFFTAGDYRYEELLPGIKIMLRDYPEGEYHFNNACHFACLADDKQLAALLINRIDPATYWPLVWEGYGRVERWRRAVDPSSYQGDDLMTLVGRNGWVHGVAFLNDNNKLLSSGFLQHFDIWSLKSQKQVDHFESERPIRVIAVDDAAKQVIASTGSEQSPDNEAVVYSLQGDHEARALKGHTGSVESVAITRDGGRYGTAARDNTAKIWRQTDLENPLTLKHPEWVYDIAFSPDGKTAATASFKGGIWLWNAQTGEPIGAPLVEMNTGPWQCKLGFVPDGNALITASVDGTIRCWDLATRKFQMVRPDGNYIWGMAISPDGKWLAVGRNNGRVDVLALQPLRLVHSYRGHHDNTQALAFSPDGKTLAAGSNDDTIKIWNIENLPRPGQTVRQSADGAIVLTAFDAQLHGDQLTYEAGNNCIGYWNNSQEWIQWDVQIDKPGKFSVTVTTACAKGSGGSQYAVVAGPEKLPGTVKETADWATFSSETLGTLEIPSTGRIAVSVRLAGKATPAVMNVRSIELRPEK